MAEPRHRLLVLGLGNLLLSDEGVGVHVVRELAGGPLPAGVRCLDGGTGGFELLEPLQAAERVLVVDAAISDDPPGTVRLLRPRWAPGVPGALSAHDVGLRELLDACRLLGAGPADVQLVAVTIDPRQDLGSDLSPAVAEAALRAAALAREEMAREEPVPAGDPLAPPGATA